MFIFQVQSLSFFKVEAMNHEKVPYPPAYTEIYPAVPVGEMNPQNMGWQQPNIEVVMPQQPPASYGTVVTQQPGKKIRSFLIRKV